MIGRPNIRIKVKQDEVKEIPTGAEYIKENGRIISLKMEYKRLRKPEKDSLHLYPNFESNFSGNGGLFYKEIGINSKIYEHKDIDYDGKSALEDCMDDEKSTIGLYQDATITVREAIKKGNETEVKI